MPLSRLDLRHIVEAIRELYRTVETPPAEDWESPAWLIEYNKRAAARGEREVPLTKPIHAALIDAAAAEILYRIMPPKWVRPPIQHREKDCPRITKSSLDQAHKAVLFGLWKQLQSWPVRGGELAGSSGEALEFLAYLDSVLEQLTGERPQGADRDRDGAGQAERAGAPRDQAGAGQGGGAKPKGKRGRKSDTDPKADQRVADAWRTRQYRTYSECGRALGITCKQVKEAIDRCRHRAPGKRHRRTPAPE
jgi:hypothetical protein